MVRESFVAQYFPINYQFLLLKFYRSVFAAKFLLLNFLLLNFLRERPVFVTQLHIAALILEYNFAIHISQVQLGFYDFAILMQVLAKLVLSSSFYALQLFLPNTF